MPAPSVKLIRPQLPDNSIISGSSTTENPSKLQKLQWRNITEHYWISEFTPVWAESTGTMPSGQSSSQCFRYTVGKTECWNGVVTIFLSCPAPILYVSHHISGAVLLNVMLREAKFTTKHCIVNTHLVILLISLRRAVYWRSTHWSGAISPPSKWNTLHNLSLWVREAVGREKRGEKRNEIELCCWVSTKKTEATSTSQETLVEWEKREHIGIQLRRWSNWSWENRWTETTVQKMTGQADTERENTATHMLARSPLIEFRVCLEDDTSTPSTAQPTCLFRAGYEASRPLW